MALADDLRTIVRSVRGIPGQLGIRPHRVFLVRALSDGFPGDGFQQTSEVEIVEGNNQPPRVRQLNDEQRALGGLASGALQIGPITPPQDDVGITAADLSGATMEAGSETLRVRVQGPTGNNLYTIAKKTQDSATKWILVVEPVAPVAE